MGASFENVNSGNTDSFMKGWGSDGSMNFYDYTRSAMSASGVMDPTSIFTQFGQAAPGLMSLALDTTNPYVKAIDAAASSVATDSARAAEGAYSADNSFYSSGALDAGRKAASDINLQAQVNKTQAQTTMVGNLLSGGMSMLTSSRATTAGLLGNMLGVGSDLATPVYQKNDPVGDAIGMGISAVGAVGGILAAPATGGLSLLGTIASLANMTSSKDSGGYKSKTRSK